MDRTQTLIDKLFCAFIHTRNRLREPAALRRARSNWPSSSSNYINPTEPLISVYVPTYNRGKLLVERPIPSVLNQTYKNFEFLIIGDCCDDATEELVSKIDDPRIHFHNLPSRGKRYPVDGEHALNHWLAGPVVAANYALSIAKGDWIARLDDSVVWTADHLEALLNEAQTGDFEFVTGDVLESRNGVSTRNKGHYAHSDYYFSKRKPLLGVGNPRLGSTSTLLYRSYLRLFKYNINCWRKRVNRVNDIDLFLRMYHAGVKMGHLDQVVCTLLPRPGESDLAYRAFVDDLENKKRHFSFDH